MALVATFVLSPISCGLSDHGKSGGSGSAGSDEPAGGAGIGGPGIAGNSGAAGTGGTTGIAGNGAGAAGIGGTSGSGGNGPGAGGNGPGSGGNSPGAAGATGIGGNTGAGGSGSGDNLITNGDFSAGDANWHTEMGTGNINNGAYCVSSPGAATLVGWSATAGSMLSLSGGYKLSYQASGGGMVHVKIGMAVSPFGPDFEGNDSVSGSLQTFTHTFSANDSNAGVAFTFMNAGSSTVCLDNVSLTAN